MVEVLSGAKSGSYLCTPLGAKQGPGGLGEISRR